MIVDAPATGHALAMLEAPETFKKIARVGPIHRQAGYIQSFLHDPATTAIVAVATAEEMPVNETLDLRRELRERVGLDIALGVVNALEPEYFTAKELDRRCASRTRSRRSRPRCCSPSGPCARPSSTSAWPRNSSAR